MRRQWSTRGIGLLLPFQPGFDIRGPKTEQAADLDGWGKVSTGRVAIVDCLLSHPQESCKHFGGKKLFHVVMLL